jgi:3'(2'), 5'-bisphosphate nucleotidase
MTDLTDPRAVLDDLCAIARAAGAAILEIYGQNFGHELKHDRSPLTEADRAAHAIIESGLVKLVPKLPLLSEEAVPPPAEERRRWPRYWLVDPLDGTKEFLSRNGEFTVNIALVDAHRAALGVVFAPVLDRLYFGAVGRGAWRQDGRAAPVAIHVRETAVEPWRIVGSRSHPSPELATYLAGLRGRYELTSMGSSLKICLVAEGAADVYPRLGPTSEWDTAAAQAILESAGGRMIDRAGQPLRYNSKDDLLNPHFLAFGDHRRDWLAPIRNS